MKKWLLAGAGACLAAAGLWFGISWWQAARLVDAASVKPVGGTALDEPPAPSGVVTINNPADLALAEGATPMAERVAVIGLLNKRNGVASDVAMKPGEARRFGDVVIRLRACEQTAPWEPEHLTGGFVQVDVQQANQRWARIFSGWLFKERPALNVVQHPVYDVWVKSCTMSFPSTGPDTVVVASAAPRSSAKKSADEGDDSAPAPQSGPEAAPAPGAPPAAAKPKPAAPSIAADSSPK